MGTSRDYAATIASLIAKAERTDNMQEKAAYHAKAQELMQKLRIEQEDLIANDATADAPIQRDIVIVAYFSDLSAWYRAVFREITVHCGIRAYTQHVNGQMIAHCVGYEVDINYAEFLWTAALMMFATRIDPRWDENLDEAENIWRLRNAGTERRKIADMAWGTDAGLQSSNRNKVQRVYLQQCAIRGEAARATGLGHQADVYRVSYARGFAEEFRSRLAAARGAVNTSGGVVTLHGRAERVDEAFYTAYPIFRPRPDTDDQPVVYTPCEKCLKAKGGACRDHRVSAEAIKRWDRLNNSRSAASGVAAGRASARDVIIQRGSTKTGELDS